MVVCEALCCAPREEEDKRMQIGRRRFFAIAAASAALLIQPARAQVLSGTDCSVGFVNGLVQLGAGCQLTPPGLGMAVAPPSHLVALSRGADAGTASDATPPQSGGRRQRAAQRHRLQKQRRLAHERRQRKRSH